MGALTQQGLAAFKNGQKKEARQYLSRAVQQDPNDLQAWLYLAAVVETDRERSHCLTQALRIDPHQSGVRQALEKIHARLVGSPAPPPAQPPPVSPFSTASFSPPAANREDPFSQAVEPQFPQAAPLPRRAEIQPETWTPAALSPAQNPAAASDRAAAPLLPETPAPKGSSKRGLWVIAVVLVGLILVAGTALVRLLPGLTAQAGAPPAAAEAASPLPVVLDTLTPSLTRTPRPTATQTPTITPKPTRTATPTQTLIPLGPTVQAQMENIARQVSDLRGLPIKADVPGYLVTKQQAKDFLLSSYVTEDLRTELEHQKRTLVALGLVKETYDMVGNAINYIADNIGGFYTPWDPQIFVLAVRFGGIEHYIYSHEFTHAITDQNFDYAAMGHSPCKYDSQRCAAADALIEGDASLLMEQWWQQYAGPQDYRDIMAYIPPLFLFNQPEQFPPPFAGLDASFPYDQGKAFVAALYEKGNWAEVNRAYQNLPISTEQILHPEKYFSGEPVIPVNLPDLTETLGAGWELTEQDSLGEWKTYLLLGYPADVKAGVPDETAIQASQGWGGDQYQVYYQAERQSLVLVGQWVWDSANDQNEFHAAFHTQLNERFRGNVLERGHGDCWSANDQVTCLFRSDGGTLWLLASSEEELNAILPLFPDF